MSLILVAALGIASLLVLVMVLRLHAFVALLLVSMGVGLAAGMELSQVLLSVETGMASTLGFIAIVVGLGAMFGQMLEVSGGAQQLARTLVASLGQRRAAWALSATGFLVAIPVFFDVGFIILVPMVFSMAREARRPVLAYALPLLAGLAVAHAFIPPTPGPMAVARVLEADLGRVILFGLAAGIPAVIVAGPLWARVAAARIPVPAPPASAEEAQMPDDLPSFGVVLGLTAIPILLIVANTVSGALAPDTGVARVFAFCGHPFVALLVATLLAFWLLGVRRGLSLEEVQRQAGRSLGPSGLIILVTGAGGVFKQVLTDSGIGEQLARTMLGVGLTPVLFAFLVALVVRVSQGSATVSMMTAAGFVAPLLASFPDVDRALVTIAIAAGATAMSHVNDSGFWLVKEYLGLTEAQTLASWTVLSTLVGVVGLIAACLASLLL